MVADGIAKQTQLGMKNCTRAFQDYFNGIRGFKSLMGYDYTPVRKRVKVKENLKVLGNWKGNFNGGVKNESGHVLHHGAPACFKHTFYKNGVAEIMEFDQQNVLGSGPCAKFYKGTECDFYPQFNYISINFPGCCDTRGCFCECISVCFTKEMVIREMKKTLEQQDFFIEDQCTTAYQTPSEGMGLKLQQRNQRHWYKILLRTKIRYLTVESVYRMQSEPQ